MFLKVDRTDSFYERRCQFKYHKFELFINLNYYLRQQDVKLKLPAVNAIANG